MTLPNTFIIGAPKSGTTSLADYLSAHPAAFVCRPKEPFFWSDDYPGLAERLGIRSIEDYRRLFSAAGPQHIVVAEASTNYLCSEQAVRSIRTHCTGARFIVMLRDPVEVAHAFHMEQLFCGNEDVADFASAWALQAERLRGQALPRGCFSPRFLQYGACVRFGEQVARLLSEVDRADVLFLRFEDFRRDVAGSWSHVLDFLGLPPDGRQDFPVSNPAHAHRMPGFARWLYDPPALLRSPLERLRLHLRRRSYPLVESIKAGLRRPALRRPVDRNVESELRQQFAPDLRELQRLLGWDLSAWMEAGRPCLPS